MAFLLSFSACYLLNAQNDHAALHTGRIAHQLEIRHDNDFFVLTDRYYSFGLFLTYRHALAKGIFGSENEQLQFMLGEEAFTPDDTKTTDISQMDRPYAGFLGLKSGWSVTLSNNLIELDLLLGIAGKASGAGALQRWYHNAVVISNPQSWIGELENSVHLNIYATYTYEWRIAPLPFGVHIAAKPQIAFGSRDTFIFPEFAAYFGRRAALKNSVSNYRIGSIEREIFFALRAGYRYTLHDGLLEGNAFGDDSLFLTTSEATQFHLGFDFQHRSGQNDFRFGYRRNTKSSTATKSHQYIILSYARSL